MNEEAYNQGRHDMAVALVDYLDPDQIAMRANRTYTWVEILAAINECK